MLANETFSTPTSIQKPEARRVHYLDNLRALAMLLGVFLHAGLAYADPAQSIWLATDTRSSKLVDASIWLIHLFRMSLFFLLSGYASKLMLDRRGVRGYLWNRLQRIVLPFVLFYPVLLAATTIVIVFAINYLKEPRGLMGLIVAVGKAGGEAAKSPPPGTMHLWFLYYLAIFSGIGALSTQVRWPSWSFGRFTRWLWPFTPLLLVPSVMKAGVPLPAPESFLPSWWPIVFYGSFFLAGWQLFGRERHLERCERFMWPIIAGCLILYAVYYSTMPSLDLATIEAALKAQSPWRSSMQWLLTAYLSALLTLSAILVGKRYLYGRHDGLKFMADASYWIYLVHLPVVLFLQTILIPIACPVWLKLLATIVGTFAFSMSTYLVFVRYTPIGWLLNGKRSFP